MNRPVIWGLVGAGDVCEKKSGPPLYELPGHSLRAVTRRNREAGEDFARRHGPCEYLPDLDSILKRPEINAVYVATPPRTHAEQTLAAAGAGKHVLVEKPMAMNTAECDRMIGACREAGVLLGVAYYRRGYPSILRAKELLQQGVIGELTGIELNDTFPPSHRLDLFHFFAGDLRSIRLESVSQGAVLHGETAAGVRLRMNLGWVEIPGVPEQIRLTGSDGELFVEDLKGGHLRGRVREDAGGLPWTHWGLIENFGFALAGTAPLACSGEEGRKSTVILDWVSTLEPDAAPVTVDYAAPPGLNLTAATRYHLLG